MKEFNTDIDIIAQAVSAAWGAAHESETHADWLRRWARVYHMLSGMWNIALWGIQGGVDQSAGFRDDIDTLRDVVHELTCGWEEYSQVETAA